MHSVHHRALALAGGHGSEVQTCYQVQCNRISRLSEWDHLVSPAMGQALQRDLRGETFKPTKGQKEKATIERAYYTFAMISANSPRPVHPRLKRSDAVESDLAGGALLGKSAAAGGFVPPDTECFLFFDLSSSSTARDH